MSSTQAGGGAGNSYVYLLRDPNISDPIQSIFYVGKGTGLRAGQHALEAERQLSELADTVDGTADQAEVDHKLARLRALLASNTQPQVDVLTPADGTGLATSTAFDIEAALIAVLRMTELGNKVRGHRIRLVPESVFDRASTAKLVPVPARYTAIAVPVDGLWGGRDYAGTLLSADASSQWENARQLWSSLKADRVTRIEALAKTDCPAVLIALAKHPRPERRNIVVGVFELVSAHQTERMKGDYWRGEHYVKSHPGWEFTRREPREERSSTVALRKQLLGNILSAADGTPKTRPQDRHYLQGF